MFEGNPKLENLDDASKMMMEFVLASASAETQLKACTAAMETKKFSTVIEEASKAINLIEKSPQIVEMVAGSMVMLYAMRASSYQSLGEAHRDTDKLYHALRDYSRFGEIVNMLSDKQRAFIEQRGMVAAARSSKAEIRTLLKKLENTAYQSRISAKKKPWWKFW
ncbi:MAG: hypothetical protein MUC85_01360 [Anaerolineales bacterium]|nr:hypothetical protein [Anaerolineales bacterium]